MKKFALFFFCFALLFQSCFYTDSKKNSASVKPISNSSAFYGGVFRVNETEFYRSLMPLNVTEVVGHRITNQIYEGLVMLDPGTLEIKPCLADSWTVSNDALTYTFYLRKDVLYHEDLCFENIQQRRFNAYEAKYSFDRLCKPAPYNQGYWIFQDLVVGAD